MGWVLTRKKNSPTQPLSQYHFHDKYISPLVGVFLSNTRAKFFFFPLVHWTSATVMTSDFGYLKVKLLVQRMNKLKNE